VALQDLVALVADKNMQFALQGALARPQALGIRCLSYDFRTHMGRDGGVRTNGAELLELEAHHFNHALMLLDFEGCGREHESALALENQLDDQLHSRWGGRAKAIVISPEVDIWLWGAENALQQALRWSQSDSIRDWLRRKDFEFRLDGKPRQPKEALELICREQKLARSSALYERITSRISLKKCTDPAFERLRAQLLTWFGL
jgi:hypothetical protein